MTKTKGDTVKREDLVRLLNEDLAREYQAIIAYVVYSQVLKGAQYMNIAGELEKHAADQLAGAQGRVEKLKDFKLTIAAKAGTEGKLFGSIGTSDIAEAATKAGHPLARSEVRLPTGPLRMVGEYAVELHLHADVNVELPVVIVAEEAA